MSELYFLNDKTTLNYSPAVIIKKKKEAHRLVQVFYFLNTNLNYRKYRRQGNKVNCVTPSDNTKVWNTLNNNWIGHFKKFPQENDDHDIYEA